MHPLVTDSSHTATHSGATVWLTGLPSSGKSTLAEATGQCLRAEGYRVHILDGDELRRTLCSDLGFSRQDRCTNVERIGYVASLLARNGIIVLVAVIAPYVQSRARVRSLHAQHDVPYIEVHVATPQHICEQRDVKGLYARSRAGDVRGLTGVDDPYEAPEMPELCVETTCSVDDVSSQILKVSKEYVHQEQE